MFCLFTGGGQITQMEARQRTAQAATSKTQKLVKKSFIAGFY